MQKNEFIETIKLLDSHIFHIEYHQERLKNTGYDAQVAFNSGNSMYRVVAATFDNKASAVQSRNQLRNQYPDAWLLSK